ncbi:MAG: hypothetical protein K6T88_01630 [Bacillus sp. (in: Bacteria)]|nr:hypothetical protein [Bacillus sp. (in: firmicutes)]
MSHKKGSFRLRRKLIIFMMLFFSTALILNTFNVSAVDTYYLNHTPAKNSTIKLANPKISVYVKSLNELDSTSVKMIVNGSPVNSSFLYKGRWVDDYYEGQIYRIESRKEGTISFDASNLKDGVNTIEVSIYDKASPPNLLSDTWTFTVAEAPKFTNISPADKSEQTAVNQISAKVIDNTTVDWATVKLKINNSYVNATNNQSDGTINYSNNFPSGNYTAVLEAKDSSIPISMGTKTWSFVVDSLAPEVVYGVKDGAVISDGKLNVNIKLKDLVDIKDNVSLTLDGVPLNMNFRYEGEFDYYDDYIISSRKVAYITYEGIVPNGDHTLTLFSEDKLGNKETHSWNFTVASKPVVSDESPIKYGVTDLKPVISAVVKSPSGSVKAEQITLIVNGETVNFDYDAITGKVTYTPTEPLKNESYQTVNLTVSASPELSESREWKFYTNKYPDMKDSNYQSCSACHTATSFPYSNGVLENVHSGKLTFGGTHSRNKCENCHNYVTVEAGCSQCHEDLVVGGRYGYAPHGSTPTIKYQAKTYVPKFPIRIKDNREIYDCIVCHQPGSQVKGYGVSLVIPSRLLNNHDIPELHKTSDESCTKCHAQSLTHEHAREGRTDNEGNLITCNTCHQSTDTKVVLAIKDKNPSCSACHGEASHDDLHVYNEISDNCTGCHSNTLTIEHKNRDINCSSCHDSLDPIVVNAIDSGNTACQTCHTKPIHEAVHSQCTNCHSNTNIESEVAPH